MTLIRMHLHSHVAFILYRAAMLGSILPPVCENSDIEIYFTYRWMCHTDSANTAVPPAVQKQCYPFPAHKTNPHVKCVGLVRDCYGGLLTLKFFWFENRKRIDPIPCWLFRRGKGLTSCWRDDWEKRTTCSSFPRPRSVPFSQRMTKFPSAEYAGEWSRVQTPAGFWVFKQLRQMRKTFWSSQIRTINRRFHLTTLVHDHFEGR